MMTCEICGATIEDTTNTHADFPLCDDCREIEQAEIRAEIDAEWDAIHADHKALADAMDAALAADLDEAARGFEDAHAQAESEAFSYTFEMDQDGFSGYPF